MNTEPENVATSPIDSAAHTPKADSAGEFVPCVLKHPDTALPIVEAVLVEMSREPKTTAPSSPSAPLPLSAHPRYDRRVAMLRELLDLYFTVTLRPGDLSATRSRGGWLITWVKDDEERLVLQSFHKCLLSIAERMSRSEDTR